jgi:hypothetical protein
VVYRGSGHHTLIYIKSGHPRGRMTAYPGLLCMKHLLCITVERLRKGTKVARLK